MDRDAVQLATQTIEQIDDLKKDIVNIEREIEYFSSYYCLSNPYTRMKFITTGAPGMRITQSNAQNIVIPFLNSMKESKEKEIAELEHKLLNM